MRGTVNSRLGDLILALKHTEASFSRAIGEHPRNTNRILNGVNGPSLKYLAGIMVVYPNVNIRWLVLGEGKMFT